MRKKMVLLILCLVFWAVSVYAETKTYTFIFDYEGMYKLSEITSKADSESNYYVTQTGAVVSQNTAPRTRYYSYYNRTRVSYPLNLSYDDFAKHYEGYTTANPSTGIGYQLYGQFVTGTGTGFSQITGRWTP